jgi:hypothetical protein
LGYLACSILFGFRLKHTGYLNSALVSVFSILTPKYNKVHLKPTRIYQNANSREPNKKSDCPHGYGSARIKLNLI